MIQLLHPTAPGRIGSEMGNEPAQTDKKECQSGGLLRYAGRMAECWTCRTSQWLLCRASCQTSSSMDEVPSLACICLIHTLRREGCHTKCHLGPNLLPVSRRDSFLQPFWLPAYSLCSIEATKAARERSSFARLRDRPVDYDTPDIAPDARFRLVSSTWLAPFEPG